jgi:hypothetical protein
MSSSRVRGLTSLPHSVSSSFGPSRLQVERGEKPHHTPAKAFPQLSPGMIQRWAMITKTTVYLSGGGKICV